MALATITRDLPRIKKPKHVIYKKVIPGFPGQARDDSKMHLGNLSQPLIILFYLWCKRKKCVRKLIVKTLNRINESKSVRPRNTDGGAATKADSSNSVGYIQTLFWICPYVFITFCFLKQHYVTTKVFFLLFIYLLFSVLQHPKSFCL